MATKKRTKKLNDLEHGALEVRRQLDQLGVKEGYAPIALYGRGVKVPLPSERWPRVFRALYEAIDYVRGILHQRSAFAPIGSGSRVLIVLTDGYTSQVIWDSARESDTQHLGNEAKYLRDPKRRKGLAFTGEMSKKWQNSTARRRVHARYRARLIRLLGWAPEVPGDPSTNYAATTGELASWAREKSPRRSRRDPQGHGHIHRNSNPKLLKALSKKLRLMGYSASDVVIPENPWTDGQPYITTSAPMRVVANAMRTRRP